MQPGQTSQGTTSGSYGRGGMIPSPWFDYASLSVPDHHENVLYWARYFWLTDGNYRTAMERVASHFLTTLDFPELDPDDEGEWRTLFERHMNYRREFKAAAEDFLCYNNVIISLYLPFRRFLVCPDCWSSQPIEMVDYKLTMQQSASEPLTWSRNTACPVCGSHKKLTCVERRDADLSRIKLNRYNPGDVELAQNRFSRRKTLRWKIPRTFRADVTAGARIFIDDTPLPVLEAIAQGRNFEFDNKMVLHIADPTISGMETHGWGVPRCISNFRAAWLQQLEHKTDQVTAIDYTVGMRLLSPTPTVGGQDPMINNGMQEFAKRMKQIVDSHRANQASYHVTPYPVQYLFAGGEGKDLLPVEKMKFRQQEYLNQMGVPLEWHQMNLSTQAAPMSLRLFESYWQGIPALYNDILSWVVDLVSSSQGMVATKAVMERSTVADDIERKNVLLQLMSANQLSPQTALKPYGVNAHEEVKNLFRYEDYVARLQQENDEKMMKREEMGVAKQLTSHPTPTSMMEEQMMAQEQAAGGMPGAPMGGAPMSGAPMGGLPGMDQQPRSLSAISEQAQMIAEQLVRMDEHARRGELKALREGNKDLHALVIQKMTEIRRSAQSEGGQMLLRGGM